MSIGQHHPILRPFLLLPFALLLAGIAFTVASAGAAGATTSGSFNAPLFFNGSGHGLNEIDIMAFDLP